MLLVEPCLRAPPVSTPSPWEWPADCLTPGCPLGTACGELGRIEMGLLLHRFFMGLTFHHLFSLGENKSQISSNSRMRTQPVPQSFIHPRLPARPARAEGGQHVVV